MHKPIQYDPYNNPTSILKGSLATFGYDSGGQRYKQGGEQEIIYIDKLYEQRNGSQHQYYVGDYAVITDEGASRELSYLHTDRLGSIIAISDELGNVNQDEQRGYDPFGKPRENDADPTDGSNGDLNGYQKTTRGYTGHEHLNGTNLIHMNGRVYDYNLGRFMSVDPIIQAPANSQSMNPYSYIMNNPLSGTDPSGYASVDDKPGNSDTGGSGKPSTSPEASSAQRINVSRESKTGSRISNTKITVGDGSVTLDRSGNIIATSGNPGAALAAIGQAMAMNASQGSGATNSPTTQDGGGGNQNADIGRSGEAPGNTGGGVQNAMSQVEGVDSSNADNAELDLDSNRSKLAKHEKTVATNVEAAYELATEKLKAYHDKVGKRGGTTDWDPEDFEELDFELKSGFRKKEDINSDGNARAEVSRREDNTIREIRLYASGIANTDPSVASIAETLIHEFYHTTPTGTQQLINYRKTGIALPYEERQHEIDAKKFAKDVLK